MNGAKSLLGYVESCRILRVISTCSFLVFLLSEKRILKASMSLRMAMTTSRRVLARARQKNGSGHVNGHPIPKNVYRIYTNRNTNRIFGYDHFIMSSSGHFSNAHCNMKFLIQLAHLSTQHVLLRVNRTTVYRGTSSCARGTTTF